MRNSLFSGVPSPPGPPIRSVFFFHGVRLQSAWILALNSLAAQPVVLNPHLASKAALPFFHYQINQVRLPR